MDIKTIVADFTKRLSALIESQAMDRARTTVLSAFGGPVRRGPGRPPKNPLAAPKTTKLGRPRKKPPLQLCPVPRCKNTAAPIFGMVCAQHKNVAKSKIKKYREARKAKQQGVKVVAKRMRKRRAKVVAKKAAKQRAKPATKKPAKRRTKAAATSPVNTDTAAAVGT